MIHVYHYSYDHYAACFYCIVSIIIILLRLSVVYIAMIIIAMIAVLLQSLSWSSSLVLFAIWSLFLWLSCSSLFLAVLGHHHSIQRHDTNLNPLHLWFARFLGLKQTLPNYTLSRLVRVIEWGPTSAQWNGSKSHPSHHLNVSKRNGRVSYQYNFFWRFWWLEILLWKNPTTSYRNIHLFASFWLYYSSTACKESPSILIVTIFDGRLSSFGLP